MQANSFMLACMKLLEKLTGVSVPDTVIRLAQHYLHVLVLKSLLSNELDDMLVMCYSARTCSK